MARKGTIMKSVIDLMDPESWSKAIEFDGDLSPSSTRALLRVQFSAARQERMRELLAKSRAGTLSPT